MSGSRSAGPVVLLEGESDRLALEQAARVLGRPLAGVAQDVLGGITNLRSRLMALAASGAEPVLGLYDTAEERFVVGALAAAGRMDAPAAGTVFDALAAVGFHGCARDLEDEVIRAAGPELVLETLAARGELALFRVFQGQPAQRVRSVEAQLHRFAGTAGGRKAHFAADVIAALPADRIPAPLRALLDDLASPPRPR